MCFGLVADDTRFKTDKWVVAWPDNGSKDDMDAIRMRDILHMPYDLGQPQRWRSSLWASPKRSCTRRKEKFELSVLIMEAAPWNDTSKQLCVLSLAQVLSRRKACSNICFNFSSDGAIDSSARSTVKLRGYCR